MIKYRFGLTDEQVTALKDETFLDLAAQAELLNQTEKDIVQEEVLKALEIAFKN